MLSLEDKSLKPAVLNRIAAEIGSDCCFFLNPVPSLMEGRGERIVALPTPLAEVISGTELVLFKPSFSIATAQAYQQLSHTAFRTVDETQKSIEDFADSMNFSKLLTSFSQEHVAPGFNVLYRNCERRAFSLTAKGGLFFYLGKNINNQRTYQRVYRSFVGKRGILCAGQIASGFKILQ